MHWRREIRSGVAVALAAVVACPPAQALISLNEGRERIFVNASVSVSRDSNIFANSDNRGDYVYSTSLSADYTRRVGWIGVNGRASVGSSRFAQVREQDFTNPSFGLEFTKQTGRTTGSLTLSASRESRADASVNLRSTYWNIPVGLNFKYPISGTYTLSGSLSYSSRRYLDETVFSSLNSYSSSLDLFKILNTERDMSLGYRYRFSESSRSTSSSDHAFNVGLNGKLLRGVKGSIRAGYQLRSTFGRPDGDTRYSSWFLSGNSSYSFSRKLNLNGSISKDFSTTATDSIVDSTNASLSLQYAYSSRWNFQTGVDFGDSRFLGPGGRIVLQAGPPPVFGPNRHDNFLSWDSTASYSMNEHLKMALTYSWFKNWSTVSFADFVRSSWTFTASTRW